MAGEWNFVENALVQYRRDLKFDHVIVDSEEARKVMWQITGLQYGMNEIPLTTYAAPHYAASEIGRSLVDEMLRENRLALGDSIQREMEMEPQMAALAVQYAISWMRDHVSFYTSMKREGREPNRILGLEGL